MKDIVPRVISPRVVSRISDRTLYSAAMNPPPAEKLDNVIQFELTTGCSYNGCGFCTMYRGQKHSVKTLEEYEAHVDKVWDKVRKEGDTSKLERIFIGSGNALKADAALLQRAMVYSIASFKKNVGHIPRRIAMYGNTRDILGKSEPILSRGGFSDLSYLNCGGTCSNGCSVNKFGDKIGLGLIYWGVESGSTEVLAFADKGYNQEDLLKASNVMDNSGVHVSAMVITGLGGIRLSNQHVQETRKIINHMQPKFLTFMGIIADEKTRYGKKMIDEQAKCINRPLSDYELVTQMTDIIEGLDWRTIVGCHGTNVHERRYNPIDIGAVEIHNSTSKADLIKRLRSEATKVRRAEPKEPNQPLLL